MSLSKLVVLTNSLQWARGNQTFRERGPCEVENNGLIFFSQISPFSYNRRLGPSVIHPSGFVQYNSATKGVHRTNGPAKIHINGKKEYWIDNIPMPADAFFLKYGVL